MHRIAMLILCLVALGGCATRVTPPSAPENPGTIFLLDHGRHTSLVVSTPEGSLVRYAYGDWRYYAERQTGFGSAVAALLWSTPGALGRRALPGPPTADAVREQVPLAIEALFEIEVERSRIELLRAALDAIVLSAERQLETPETFLTFVPYPRDYNLRHNSNSMIAAWLEELGCEVSGIRVQANWHVDSATTGDAP
jgi:hypothetical protein